MMFHKWVLLIIIGVAASIVGCRYPIVSDIQQEGVSQQYEKRIAIDNLFGQDLFFKIQCCQGGCTTFTEVENGLSHLSWVRIYRRGGEIVFYVADKDFKSDLEMNLAFQSLANIVCDSALSNVNVRVVRDCGKKRIGLYVEHGTGGIKIDEHGDIRNGVL